MSVFEPGSPGVSDLLVNCQYLLDTLDYKHPVVWAIVSLLSTFCTDSRLRSFLRDRLWILPSLSPLLHPGSHSQTLATHQTNRPGHSNNSQGSFPNYTLWRLIGFLRRGHRGLGFRVRVHPLLLVPRQLRGDPSPPGGHDPQRPPGLVLGLLRGRRHQSGRGVPVLPPVSSQPSRSHPSLRQSEGVPRQDHGRLLHRVRRGRPGHHDPRHKLPV